MSGDQLKAMLRERGIRSRQVARRLGISDAYLSQQLSGARDLQPETRDAIAQAVREAEDAKLAEMEELIRRRRAALRV